MIYLITLTRTIIYPMNNLTQITTSFGKDYDDRLDTLLNRLNNSLTSDLKLIVKKSQTNEIKTYSSSYIEKILYSNNFNSYIFVLKLKDGTSTTLVEFFDVR